MTRVRHTLGAGYLVGSGTTLAVVVVAAAVSAGPTPGGAVVSLLGAIPALGLTAAPLFLSRTRVDGVTVWRTAMWAALGMGVVALCGVSLLLARLVWPAVSASSLVFVAYSAGFGGVCGALIGTLLDFRRRIRTLQEQNAVMRRVLRHDLRTEANLVLGHAKAAANAADGDRPHLDAIAEPVRRLLDRGRRVRRLQRDATTDVPAPERPVAAVVEEAVDVAGGRVPEADVEVVGSADPPVRATGLLVRAVADVVETVASHADAPVVVAVTPPAPTDRTVAVRVRLRGGGRVLPDADRHALDGGGESPLRHGRHTGLWAAKWCLERHGGRLVVAGPDEVTLELRRAEGWLPRRVAGVLATVRDRLR